MNKLLLALVVVIAPMIARASCWSLTGCHSMKFSKAKGPSGHLAPGETPLKFLSLAVPGKDEDRSYRCLENVRAEGIRCEYFYHCRPEDNSKPNKMDLDSTDFVELRWTVAAADVLKKLQLRGAAKGLASWQDLDVKFEHNPSISSGDPSCHLPKKN
jgi:hypothetical protein